ncbi:MULTISPECIES: alpha/beta fold hydrolase [Pseudonocardia]|uniref:Alpha/beta hydrolase family protein n=2 Tax=Pseudonocardia TaxID=1847 RepID=A0A1Y2N1E7_PSEAH|nr:MULTISPECIES: alpha/beta fold hydrolase [Pseudonocardia]OSY41260.1 Alpha/beta hydrolase family protein [Pseudonocardia autotrophica]TDN76715.1 alpha/beta hydrolase family protein [Pseudonocardia autotrophica]BBG00717.1 alpha/beta hydrolase [Pseudonocardia autotrophica]GEC24317.1 alpha/beta hydrolase [Pseudonocardia saturnea]
MPDPMPWLETAGRTHPAPAGVVLVAHGGRAHSTAPARRRGLAYRRMPPFARAVERAGREHRTGLGSGIATHLLRYRVRGWNGPAMDALRDVQWAVRELTDRHPGRPVVLVGHSMGGRAVLGAAGAAGVVAVCGLAPWLDDTDPVAQLAGRAVLIAHGDRERMTDPAASYAYALRAREVTDRVARFDVHGDGHAMLRRAADWTSLVSRFVLGELGAEPRDPVISNAMTEPAPAGLRVALEPARR